MSPIEVLLLSTLIAFAAKTLAWVLQWRNGNAGLVDPIWAWTLGSLAVLYALLGSAPAALRLVLAGMGGVWGLRLGVYLWRRNAGRAEDWRYAQFRRRWGKQAQLRMFGFFQFQNVFTLTLAASAFAPVAYRQSMPSIGAFVLAGALWLAAVLGEAIADAQLSEFRANPAAGSRVCRVGLWRYSRHPNYFFECLHWCAYVPLALGAPFGWATLAAPVVMATLLMKISGVPLLENELVRRKPDYAAYMRTTSALVPWPPRSDPNQP